MRVGMCTKWIDEAYTGVGRYTIKVLDHMMDLEDAPEFHLIHRQQGGDPVYGRAAEEHIYKPRIETLWWHYQDRFCKGLSSQLDVIHEPFVGFRTRMDCPQVLTFHDAVPLMHPEFAPRTFAVYFKRMMPKVVSRADAIICNSERTREDLLEHYSADPDKTFVTYLGVDPPDVVGESTLTDKEPYMLALSNTLMKNIGFTVGEFISYKDVHGGDLRLIVVGSDYSGLSQGRTDVEVLDYLPRDTFVELMAGAEALLFPSHYEGFGFPPLEAMSMCVPTVVSDRGSLPEVVGDASLVVDIDRKGSLVEAIHRLRTEEGLAAELRAKGNERYKGFTWDKCARATLGIYEGLSG
ncbi:MAG: glycosyltransferase family 4 protein [Thermoplasmata archaeon]|nr:glycosyltransferase family 4 protein [Thermoplasmata archaeon]